jgi:hypothetical protein
LLKHESTAGLESELSCRAAHYPAEPKTNRLDGGNELEKFRFDYTVEMSIVIGVFIPLGENVFQLPSPLLGRSGSDVRR